MVFLDEAMNRVRFIISDVDGVLTDGGMGFDAQGRPFRLFNVRDGVGLALWRFSGYQAALVSGLGSPALDALAKQWRCASCHSHVMDKESACRQIAREQRLSMEEIAFVGDDLIDLDAMRVVGLGVAVADAASEIVDAADYVLDTPGGKGALRELAERLLKHQGRYAEAVERYYARGRAGRSSQGAAASQTPFEAPGMQ